MTNIIGGNSGKIQQFDQGPDGLAANGTGKSQTADFFQLISLLSDDLSDSTIEGEKSSETNNMISNYKADHFSQNEFVGLTENLEALLEPGKDRNVNSSTLSQLSGIIKSSAIAPRADNELQLKNLLSTISLELDKLQLGNDFLAIKNSKIGLKDATEAFLGLLEENSSEKTDKSKILDYLKVILPSENLPNFPSSKKLSDNTFESSVVIKNLPFESGRNGSLLLDLSALKATVLEKNEEIALTSNLYLDRSSLLDNQNKNQNNKIDAFNLAIEISANGLNAEVSNLSYGNSTLQKEKFPPGGLDELSVITVEIPNKNLAALNVTISIENSKGFIIPETYAVINFDGSQDFAGPAQQPFDLTRIESLSPSEGEPPASKISQIIAGTGLEQKDFVVDETQIIKSFQPNRGINSLTENVKTLSSELITSSEPSLINKIDLSEISSVDFAKFLKDRLQAAVSSVTKKLNFKKDIAEFLEASKAAVIIREATSKVAKKEVGLSESRSVKKKLFLSSADVIGYRLAISGKVTETDQPAKNSRENHFIAGKENADLAFKSPDEQIPTIRGTNTLANFGSTIQASLEQSISRLEPAVDRSLIVQSHNFSQRISLLESQFSSRLSNALLEQAINSNESFDLILEPESFGKVRVNVSVDSSQIDVKLIAENSSTLAILRSSESMLQVISEQNGLKLAEYNVELNNNAQNNEGSQGRKNEKDHNSDFNEGVEELENKLDPLVENDDIHSLNLIA
tara:strand:+ start:331 stop:2562 length:2232 start_codon:yes stop_codon:yes gene_type:complete